MKIWQILIVLFFVELGVGLIYFAGLPRCVDSISYNELGGLQVNYSLKLWCNATERANNAWLQLYLANQSQTYPTLFQVKK